MTKEDYLKTSRLLSELMLDVKTGGTRIPLTAMEGALMISNLNTLIQFVKFEVEFIDAHGEE